MTTGRVRAHAPGRVNLIGDHTDYTGGLVLPMAIDLGTTVEYEPGDTDRVVLRSSAEPEAAIVALPVDDPRSARPSWARYVAGVAAQVRPTTGGTGTLDSTVPRGSGLSSSAALEVSVALALGFSGTPVELALACQRAEQAATGTPSGIMDQLASAAGVEGSALRIDCSTLQVTPVPFPGDAEVVVVDSGQQRDLGGEAGRAYAERRASCEAAEAVVGPLRTATLDDLVQLRDPVLLRRARHVVSENARVRECSEALAAGDLRASGHLMLASHASLRDDYEVSTPELDALVARLTAVPGVHGARVTGAGFGGCVVALTDPGALAEGWHVRPVAGASVQPA